jgi:hypothetical protein
MAAREMGVDVFVWGGTHRFEALELEGRFFINPGSATGAIAPGYWHEGYRSPKISLMSREEPVPSFMLMDLQGMSLVLYIYTLENGQIKVEKVRSPLKFTLTVVIISERGVIDGLDWLQVWLHNGTLHLHKEPGLLLHLILPP